MFGSASPPAYRPGLNANSFGQEWRQRCTATSSQRPGLLAHKRLAIFFRPRRCNEPSFNPATKILKPCRPGHTLGPESKQACPCFQVGTRPHDKTSLTVLHVKYARVHSCKVAAIESKCLGPHQHESTTGVAGNLKCYRIVRDTMPLALQQPSWQHSLALR